jgi:hypothetical protein
MGLVPRLLPAVTALGCAVALAGCELVFPPGGGDDDPPSGSGEARIVVDHGNSPETLVDLPVLVQLDRDTIDLDLVGNPTLDLRFEGDSASGPVDLPFEVDTWEPGGKSYVWVQVPVIPGGGQAELRLVYGAGAGGHARPEGVWADDFAAVWHLGEVGLGSEDPFQIAESANAYVGTASAGRYEDGIIGGGRQFVTEEPQRIDFLDGASLFNGWGSFTFEYWIRADEGGPFVDKGDALANGRVETTSKGGFYMQIDMHFLGNCSLACDAYVGADLPGSEWRYVVYTFDGLEIRLYVDGEEVGAGFLDANAMTWPDDAPFGLGSDQSPFTGALDEVRLSTSARSPEWVRAQLRTMTLQSVTVEPVE